MIITRPRRRLVDTVDVHAEFHYTPVLNKDSFAVVSLGAQTTGSVIREELTNNFYIVDRTIETAPYYARDQAQ